MARKTKQGGSSTSAAASPRSARGSKQQSQQSAAAAAATTTARSSPSLWNLNTQRALYLVLLAAIYAPLSQLILAPVYGAVPSAKYHKYAVTAAPLLAFTLRSVLPVNVRKVIPTFAFWIPTIQFVLLKYSNYSGTLGPLLTELVTTFPLITLTMFVAIKLVEDVELPFLSPEGNLAEAAPPMVLYAIFNLVQRLFKSTLPAWMGWNVTFSRVGLQLAIATLYGLVLPQSLFWPALPSIIFTMTANPHNPLQRTTQVLNNTLALYNYTLLDRHESLTGYLSVLEDHNLKFRVMRCDHSLLGGEWRLDPKPGVVQRVGEPIYAVFTMLEAVRLIETPSSSIPDSSKTALNIGLGVGTAPAAMIAHGVNTTVVELDPWVHYFAGKYFNLPRNHSYVIGDAVRFVHSRNHEITQNAAQAESLQYDYIIHDTFTGGVMPTSLFTTSFLKGLAGLLKPTGVIAINFAGDLDLPSAVIVHQTITSVFPTCRIFREDEEKSVLEKIVPRFSKSKSSDQGERVAAGRDKHGDETAYDGDFTNLVYFCLSPRSSSFSFSSSTAPPPSSKPAGITFRPPHPDDFLNSASRKYYMVPRHEFDPEAKWGAGGSSALSGHPETMVEYLGWFNGNQTRVLDSITGQPARDVRAHQERSAIGHWKLMRTVIPPEIWENW